MDKKMYKTDLGSSGFSIKAYIITITNNNISVVAARKLLQTIRDTNSRIQPFLLDATTPNTIKQDIFANFPSDVADSIWVNETLRWTWPINPSQDGMDFATGLYKKAYRAADLRKVMACTISHMRLWQHCIDIDQPIVVLEHDAEFIRRFDYKYIVMCGETNENGDQYDMLEDDNPHTANGAREYTGQFTGGIMGLNNPLGATRKAALFDQKVKQIQLPGDAGLLTSLPNKYGISTVPYVDDPGDLPLPSGLAGNSAYIIKPWAAKKLMEKVKEVGIWPNDALMCRQFFPWLQVYYPYFTAVQRTTSTTTL